MRCSIASKSSNVFIDTRSSLVFDMRKRFVTGLVIAASSVVAALELAAQPAAARKAAPSPGTARQIPSVVRTDYYEVSGATAEELLASLRAHQLFARHASTKWQVDWHFECQLKPNECILRSFTAQVRIRYTLPNWVDSQQADKALQGEWQRYFGALQLHESVHGGFGIAAGKEMVRLVNSRNWRAADQKELKARLDEECEKTLQEYRARETAYDEKTDHGRTQGARLRPIRNHGSDWSARRAPDHELDVHPLQ
jgi:predicted secreted Zn-dependent protease